MNATWGPWWGVLIHTLQSLIQFLKSLKSSVLGSTYLVRDDTSSYQKILISRTSPRPQKLLLIFLEQIEENRIGRSARAGDLWLQFGLEFPLYPQACGISLGPTSPQAVITGISLDYGQREHHIQENTGTCPPGP